MIDLPPIPPKEPFYSRLDWSNIIVALISMAGGIAVALIGKGLFASPSACQLQKHEIAQPDERVQALDANWKRVSDLNVGIYSNSSDLKTAAYKSQMADKVAPDLERARTQMRDYVTALKARCNV